MNLRCPSLLPALHSRACRRFICVAFARLVASAPVHAQDVSPYPSRPIRVLVGFQPGGGSDLLARLIGPKLGERLGQSVVIDNRSGAGGTIAMEITAKSQPDGYTLMVASGSQITNASLLHQSELRFVEKRSHRSRNSRRSRICGWCARRCSERKPIALAKSKPGALLMCGSSGTGSSAHLASSYSIVSPAFA